MTYVVIPVFLDENGSLSEHQKAYEPAIRTIASLASVDERIIEQFASDWNGSEDSQIVQHCISGHSKNFAKIKIGYLMLHLQENISKATKKLLGHATLDEHRQWCRDNGITHTIAYRKADKPWNFYVCPLTAFGLNSSNFFEKKERTAFVAMEACQEWCEKNGINTSKKYRAAVKPLGFPGTPWKAYKVSYYEFFGKKEKVFASIDAVVIWCRNNKVLSDKQYRAKKSRRPENFPSKPYEHYKISNSEFFGRVKSQEKDSWKPVKWLCKEVFGYEPSPQTVCRWSSGENVDGVKLRIVKIGGRVMTTKDDLMEFFERRSN